MPSRSVKSSWQDGWDRIYAQFSGYTGSFYGDSAGKISQSIQELEDSVNGWAGNQSGDNQLGGYVAEARTVGTFNANSAIKGSQFKTRVGEAERHDLASPDVIGNWDENFGLKFMKDAQASAKAQSKSFFERYCETKSQGMTIEEYLQKNNIPEDTPLYDPIYGGQTRIIPADQLEAAKSYLRWKIEKEAMTRPEQVQRYQDTLDHLQSVVLAPDGTQSVELTKEQSRELARLARERKYRAYADQFCSEDILKWNDYVNRSLKAGVTAAVITFTMKMTPVIIHMITELVKDGELDSDELKARGLEAIPATCESFIRGGIASAFTLAYQTGKFGDVFKFVEPEQVPSVIGALTVIAISTIKDAYSLANHDISVQEFMANTQQTLFVTACGIGGGIVLQGLLTSFPAAYYIGNMLGTVFGTILYKGIDNLFVALCMNNGYTFFGLVDQNYTLPEEVLKELNIDWLRVDKLSIDTTEIDECELDTLSPDECEMDYIKMLSRGVFKIHHIGYLYC